MYDLIIKNGVIITVDTRHTIYDKGYVKILEGKIAETGPMEALGDGQAKQVFDASGMAVLPGLIDAHGHSGTCVSKELCEGSPSGIWVPFAQDTFENYGDDFFWYADSALGAAEHLKFGITTSQMMLGAFPEDKNMALVDEIFKGAMKTGIRQFIAVGAFTGPYPRPFTSWKGGKPRRYQRTLEEGFDFVESAVSQFNKKIGRQFCVPGPMVLGKHPGNPDETSIAINKKMWEIADRHGTILHTHAYGGDIRFLNDTSPEVLNSRVNMVHLTDLSGEEVDIIAKTGVHPLHGPTTRSIIMRYCPVFEMLEKGVNVSIVTDGSGPDRSFDLWREMKVFQVIHRGHFHDQTLAPAGLVLKMCTINAAKALGIDHLTGSLEPGKLADIILIDTSQPHMSPFKKMPVERLVYNAQGNDVVTVFVEGEMVINERKLIKTDEQKLLNDANQAFDQLLERYGSEMTEKITTNKGLWGLHSIPNYERYGH